MVRLTGQSESNGRCRMYSCIASMEQWMYLKHTPAVTPGEKIKQQVVQEETDDGR
jgi:hypothetical protein